MKCSKFFYKTFFVVIAIVALQQVKAQTNANLIPKKGLHITTNKIDWCLGSEINVFTVNKKAHHYFFTWWDQDEEKTTNETKLLIGSNNTAVDGVYSLKKNKQNFNTNFNCNYNFKDSAMADMVFAKLWQPYFKEAVFYNGKKEVVTTLENFEDNILIIEAPFATIKCSSNKAFKLKIKIKPIIESNEYDVRKQFIELVLQNQLMHKSQPLNCNFSIEVEEKNFQTLLKKDTTINLTKPIAIWNSNDAEELQILPSPASMQLTDSFYIFSKNKKNDNVVVEQFRKILSNYWQLKNNHFPNLIATQTNNVPNEGYTINISTKKINIEYKTKQGLQHALQTLAQMVKPWNEDLLIKTGKIIDSPKVNFRGIHMFTGPTSWALHKKMYNNILLPLKMNAAVLQCEQALWQSRPETHNPISVPLKDLKTEFNLLRLNKVQPIPLIQSLGHMEWFFKPKQNRFMAINPKYPYTLNPNLGESKKAITQLWDETFELLKPTIMHIGFDEIGMIGFNEPKENEVVYFKTQMAFLNAYAKKKNAKLMLWGDMGLAPNEGPDALNGISKERAAKIRSYIPKNSYVADWHYLSNASPEVYKTNLNIWKQNGNIPIASPWLHPNNIKGFVQAAIEENAGVLQTTWADFESSEKNMLLNIEQFVAYILALDYAWSRRKTLPVDLDYTATFEWVKRFYNQPKPIDEKLGFDLVTNLKFANLSSKNTSTINEFSINFNTINSSGFALQQTVETILPEATPIATMQFYNNDKLLFSKTLLYGVHARTLNDKRPVYARATNKNGQKLLYEFFDKSMKISMVRIEVLNNATGLKIEELVLIKEKK